MRRPILLATFSACIVSAGYARPVALPGPRELTADQQVLQVLARLTFGARPGDVDKVRAIGVDRWIELQLHPDVIPDDATDDFLARSYQSLGMTNAQILGQYPRPTPQQRQARLRADSARRMSPQDSMLFVQQARRNNQFVAELQSSRVARAVMSERQLQEVMTDFWENHFTVFVGKGQTRYFLTEYDRDVIRPRALGKFRDLLGAVAKSPAMLFYLDNAQSVADSAHPTLASQQRSTTRGNVGRRATRLGGAGRRPVPMTPEEILRTGRLPNGQPLSAEQRQRLEQGVRQRRGRGLNENYARELLELHTLGVDGGYTQQDVIEVARALTGWTLTPSRPGAANGRQVANVGPPGSFLFRRETHDAGEKKVLGHKLSSGRGLEDGEQVLDIVARHPSTAKYIARKLAVRFVSDNPPPALIDRAAAMFTKTDGDIREVVRTIVTSPEFFAQAAFRSKVKSPFEVVTSALRAVGAAPDATPRTAQLIARLGQPIFGHQAPNGYPETGDAWMNTGSILNRINFGLSVASNRVPGVSLQRWPMWNELARSPREQQVDGVIKSLLGGGASPDTRDVLLSGKNPLLAAAKDSGVVDMTMATDSMSMGGAPVVGRGRGGRGRQANAFGASAQLDGLAQIVGLALGSPEFQRR